jgi:carboxypeptidase family protein
MPQRHVWRRPLAPALLVAVVALALGGCQAPFQSTVTMHGTVYGEQIAARELGKSVPIPLRATITCNDTSTASDSTGAFSFSVPKADYYTCKATAPNYSSVSAHLFGDVSAFSLTFGPKLVDDCDHGATANVLTCGLLPPATATLRGTVTNAATDAALVDVEVQCWNASTDMLSGKTPLYSTTSDELGNYVIRNMPAGPIDCVAYNDQTVQTINLTPGSTITFDLAACVQGCSTFRYHLGSVVNNLKAFLIFWLPNGYTFEPNGSSSRYEHLMDQYFQDVGGTSFYNILTQYYATTTGPIHNDVTFEGSYVDTHPYPRAGTISHPLLDSDIQDEITRVLEQKYGTSILDPNQVVFLFTGYDIQECAGSTGDDGCTFRHNVEGDFCAYHDFSLFGGYTYAYIPDIASCQYLPTTASPNRDHAADAIISIVSHEQFEAVSDPDVKQGWYDGTTYEGEMADMCVNSYGHLGSDGGNVTLVNGHRYILQEEWSLHDQQCVLSYTPSPSV